MRIALFSGNYNYLREGANQALNRLVAHVERKHGYQVRVYSPVTDTPAFEPTGQLVPVPSIALPVRREFRLALRLPAPVRADIEAFRPDLIHVSTPDILGSRAQSLARRLGVPVVASQHTRFETYLEHYGLGWLTPLVEAHLRRFYRQSDWVLCPTAALAEEMRLQCGDRVGVWSRGVDHERFSPSRRDPSLRRRWGLDDDEIAILFFGRLVLEKGIHLFIETIRRLRSRGARIRPIAIGSGPAGHLLEAIPGAVLTGHLDGAELGAAVASCDIMLTPSTTETFGNVILEAMASGLVVVSADAENSRAILRDGETGLICPPMEADGYTEAIARLIDTPAERRRIAGAARLASYGYGWEAANESVVTAYRALSRRLAGQDCCPSHDPEMRPGRLPQRAKKPS
jgi:glycosyltransferase involved in cell wall biosynthesis